MSLNKALMKAKRTDEEKVGLNIKVPVSLKNDFDALCKKNSVSMTSMMLAFIENALEEDTNPSDLNVITLLDRLKIARSNKKSYEELFDKVGDSVEDVNGTIHYPERMIEDSLLEINALEAELKRRSKK